MPIPNPKPNEKQNDFVSRCMESLREDEIPNKQKVAICYTQFKRAKKTKAFEVDIVETDLNKDQNPSK
jgi:hypothetical protein